MALEAVSAVRQGAISPLDGALRGALLALAAASLAACAGGSRPGLSAMGGAPTARYSGYRVGKPYQINGVWYYPKDQPNYDEIGIASWYGEQFHNHYTADGEVFDMHLPSAAHKTLPLPSLVEVTNLANGRTLLVRVNDRGPFVGGRVIDLSREAAEQLGFVAAGVTRVRVRYVGQADAPPSEPRQYQASTTRAPKAPAPSMPRIGAPIVQLASAVPPATTTPVAPAQEPTPPIDRAGTVVQTNLAALPGPSLPSYVAARSRAPQALADVDSLLVEAPPAASAPVAAVAAPGGLMVQAGIFASRAHAEALASRLGAAGAPDVQPFERDGQTLYRVTVGGFANADQAAAARSQAAALGAPDARVVGGS